MRRWPAAILVGISMFLVGASARWLLADRPEQLIAQAEHFAATGQADNAELALRRAIAYTPGRVQPRLLLGKLAHLRNRPATVAAVFREIPDSEPNASAIRVAEGDAWLSLNRAAAAEDCWNRAHRLAQADPAPRRRLIYLYGLQLRRDLWLRLLWELFDRGESGPRELIQMLIAGEVVWSPEESLETVRRFAQADSQDLFSRRALARYQLVSGDIASALESLDAILQAHPDDPLSRLIRIECHLATADLARAASELDELSEPARTDWRAHKSRGTLALLEQRYDDASDAFRQALAEVPFHLELRYKFAQALRLTGAVDAAEHQSRIADRLANVHRLCHTMHSRPVPDPHDLRQLVQFCEELGLIEEAMGWIRVGLESDETDPALLAARARIVKAPKTSSRYPPPHL